MDKLKRIIENVIPNEIDQDEGVFADGYVLSPVTLGASLKGDGIAEEINTSYQLDFFYKTKGILIAKARDILIALDDYPTNDITFSWEDTPRLWRATLIIDTI